MKYEVTSFNTKKMFAKSLKEVMKTKPFSKITVSELIRDCGVNRKTFYYHFTDIYDLLKWTLEEEEIEVVKNFDLVADYEKAISFVLDYVEQNEHILNCAYDSIGRDEMKRFFYKDFITLTMSIIRNVEREKNLVLEDDYRKFVGEFFTGALAEMLVECMKEGKIKERDKLMSYLSGTFRMSLSGIVERQCHVPELYGYAPERS